MTQTVVHLSKGVGCMFI